jgi:hypothetical protein
MRLLAMVSAVALTATASPLEKRQSPVATTLLGTITTQLSAMDAAIGNFAFKGDVAAAALEAVPILDSAAAVLKTVKGGVGDVNKSPQLGLGETIGILGPLGTLTSAVQKLTGDLKTKADEFDKAGLKIVVADQLASFKISSKSLVDIILDRLPLPISITIIFAQPILTALDDAATAYPGGKPEEGLSAFLATASAKAPKGAAAPKASSSPSSGGKGKGKSPGKWVDESAADTMTWY